MKKNLISVLCIVLILSAITACIKEKSNDETIENSEITEVSLEEIEKDAKNLKGGLTAKEAEKLCLSVLGDIAEENGFPISYRCTGAVSSDNEFYYVITMSWLVEGSHWSYIGNLFVLSDGSEIYDGIFLDGNCEITNLRWKR